MYFNGCNSIEELKKDYRKLAMENHPDKGGDAEVMARINAEYDVMFNRLKDAHNATNANKVNETPEEFRHIVDILSGMEGLDIELCGSWLWIGGNTMANKEGLKAAGCRWSASKKLWYWKPNGHVFSGFGHSTMKEIRSRYGSVLIGHTTGKMALEAA